MFIRIKSRLLLILCCWGAPVLSLSAGSLESIYTAYDDLLETYVSPAGVRYAAWHAQPADVKQLDAILMQMAGVDLHELSQAEQKAFYINLYNVAMLHAVFQAYPIDSVKEIGPVEFSVFKQPFIQQSGRQLSLDAIEKDILLVDYFDPRIHFSVNCASESCPPLRAEAFRAEQLDVQLDEQTRAFANSPAAARVDRERRIVSYSSLFDWYRGDFGVKNPGEYLNRYRENPVKLSYAFEWIPYDWSLNTAE